MKLLSGFGFFLLLAFALSACATLPTVSSPSAVSVPPADEKPPEKSIWPAGYDFLQDWALYGQPYGCSNKQTGESGVCAILVNPKNQQEAYLVVFDSEEMKFVKFLFHTTDGGNNWTLSYKRVEM